MSAPVTGPTLVVLAAGQARRYGGCKPLAPVGPGGEAVLDFVVADAMSAGFDRAVVVVNPTTGPALRYRARRKWPASLPVDFAEQAQPRGTVDAVLAASALVDPAEPLAVANADDVYGIEAFALLVAHLASLPAAAGESNALVSFALSRSVVGPSAVTRGICEVGPDGYLAQVVERRNVRAVPGGTFAAGDGRQPEAIEGTAQVSMNLWGFTPAMRDVLGAAMAAWRQGRPGPEGDGKAAPEVLLPDVVSAEVSRTRPYLVPGVPPQRFAVLQAAGRCIGVTHPEDLSLVQAALADQVARGERTADPWASVQRARI